MKILSRPLAAVTTVALSLVLLYGSLAGLVARHSAVLPGAALQVPQTPAKGVAMLLVDDNYNTQTTAYVDALLAQSYAVLRLPRVAFMATPASMTALAGQLSARAGVAARPPVLVALGADSSRRAASLLDSGVAHALVSVDFCPAVTDTAVLASSAVQAPWYALQHRDGRCPVPAVQRALAALPNTHLTWLVRDPRPDPKPAPEFTALVQWLDPSIAGQGQARATLRGIPLIELPVAQARRLLVFLSGDGGWAAFDRGVAAALNSAGIAVLGWDSLSYFWQARPPAVLARDLARASEQFTTRWQVHSVVAPEIAKLAPLPVWCVRGEDDSEAACPPLAPPSRVVSLPGDHHLNGDYGRLARLIAAPPLKF